MPAPPTPTKPDQDIMNEGPGLKDRARETSAVLNSVATPAGTPASSTAAKGTAVDKTNPKGAPYGTKPGEKRISDKDISDMTKGLPSYKSGTDYVPKTGPAILHKGEKVTPAKDNPMKNIYDKVTEGDAKPPKKIKSIHTRKAAGGTYIHEHHHHYPEHHKMEEHTSADDKSMLQHLTDQAPNMSETAPAMPTPGGPQGADQAQAGAVGAGAPPAQA